MGSLIAYLDAVERVPFKWGSHDCLTFTNEAVRIQRGRGWADEWLDDYSNPKAALLKYRREQLKRDDYQTIIDVADDRLCRQSTLHPSFGSVVARPAYGPLGWVFGVVGHGRSFFVGDAGLEVLDLRHDDLFWSAT